MRLTITALLILLSLSQFGCGLADPLSGLIYTHTFTPYQRDLNNTPFLETTAGGRVIQIREPFSGYGIYTEFDSNAIGDIARRNGLTKIHFVDLETFSVLDIWTSKSLLIYGEVGPELQANSESPLLPPLLQPSNDTRSYTPANSSHPTVARR